MKKLIKRVCAAICTAAMAAVMSVSAFAADYTISFTDCTFENVTNDNLSVTADEVVAYASVGSSNSVLTMHFKLTGDYRNIEFWSDPDGTVSCDILLETEGASVYAWMPAFGSGYTWVNPSGQFALPCNQWFTVTESMKHYYDGFGTKRPDDIMVQLVGATAELQDIKVTFRNFRINGADVDLNQTTVATTTTTPATTTTVATTTTTEATTTTPEPEETTTEPVETEPDESTETTPEETDPEESEPAESESEESEPTESEPEETQPAATTTTAATTTAAPADTTVSEDESGEENSYVHSTTIDYSQYIVEADTDGAATAIVAIIIAAVVIVVAAIVGFLIYKKLKFY